MRIRMSCWLLDLTIDAEEVEAFSEALTDSIERWKDLRPEQIGNQLLESLLKMGPVLLAALLALGIGYLLTKALTAFTKKLLRASKVDRTLHYFITTVVRTLLFALVIVTSLGILGVPLTPMLTFLGTAGLALSLAVQDTLSNLAGGLSILLNRPFAVGDFVTVGDTSGTVRQIRLVYTLVSSGDNKQIYLPNGDVAKAVVTNFSAADTRRLDLTFSVRGDSDLEAAKKIVLEAVNGCGKVLKDPAPVVRISGQTYLLVHIASQTWVQAGDYFAVNEQLITQVRTRLTQEGFFPAYSPNKE